MSFTTNRIIEWFGLNRTSKNPKLDAEKIRRLVQVAEKGNVEDVDRSLEEIDEILDTHGVEAIRGEKAWHKYYEDIVLLYVNTGDMYNPTIIYQIDKDKFYLTTLGDWLENPANERKYGPLH